MKKKLLFAAAMLLAAVGVNAQTDVTSTYLTNADFSQGTPIDNHVCGYGKDMAKNGTTYYGFQAVDGWSYEVVAGVTDEGGFTNSGMGGAVFAYGSEWQLKGNNKSAPATNPAGEASGNCLGFFGVWGNGGYYYQEVELPAGGYELTIPIYNQSGSNNNTSYIGFIPDEGDPYTVATNTAIGQWTIKTVKFTLTAETKGKIALGYKAQNNGSGSNPHLFFESVTITWTDPLKALKAEYQVALDAATAANEDPVYSNVDGSERIALVNSIDDTPEETAESYSEVIEALTDATDAFKAAKEAYDLAASTPELPYADPDKAPYIDEGTTAANLLIAIRAYYESNAAAEGMEGAADVTNKLTNAKNQSNTNGWTVNNTTGNCNLRTMSNEPYTYADGTTATGYLDTNSWGSAFASSVTQNVELYPGKYILSVKARGAETTTYQLTANDKTVDITSMGNTGGVFGRGWNSYTVEFELEEAGSVALGVNFAGDKWLSFGDFQLVQLELYTEMADADDYAALASAIEEAEAKTLGFDADEYAPYNNIEALQALAAAKTIDPENPGGNAKEEVVNATTALNSAWTANTEEVNAIFDGGFETDYSSQTGNVQPIGWYRIQGTDGDGYNVRYMGGTDAGLAATSTGKALFTKTAAYYGWADGYTMPLNENTYYEVTFVYGGWSDCKKDGFVTITDPQGNNIELSIDRLPLDAVDGNTNPDSWKQYRGVFKTGDAGNYVLGLRKDNENRQSQYVYGDFKLVKATPTTIDEGKTLAVGKYATRIYPFAPQAIDGVNFYACATADGNSLTLEKVEAPQACVPYILGNDADNATVAISIEQTGVDIHGKDTYTDGWLTGVFAPTTISEGYVLQTQEGKQAFYKVSADAAITVPANRAYLTVPSSTGVKSFNLGDDTTGISALEALTNNAFEAIYSADGVKLNRIEKGVNILKMSDGTTRKVVVK